MRRSCHLLMAGNGVFAEYGVEMLADEAGCRVVVQGDGLGDVSCLLLGQLLSRNSLFAACLGEHCAAASHQHDGEHKGLDVLSHNNLFLIVSHWFHASLPEERLIACF